MKNRMKLSAFFIVTLLTVTWSGSGVNAAAFNDPTWPCQQRKVEMLSLGIMWTEPLPQGFDIEANRSVTGEARDLVLILSLRRIPLQEAEEAVLSFVENADPADADIMLSIFADVFETLGDTRRDVIAGIERYSLKQIALSERIEARRSEMRVLMDAGNPDYDRIDRLEEQLDWDERVFRDRARSLTYVCETPVLIEKRLYAIAQLLLKHAR